MPKWVEPKRGKGYGACQKLPVTPSDLGVTAESQAWQGLAGRLPRLPLKNTLCAMPALKKHTILIWGNFSYV